MNTLIDDAMIALQTESQRLFSAPLDTEQLDCLYEGSEADIAGMLDDMEARMGFNVAAARQLVARHYAGEY